MRRILANVGKPLLYGVYGFSMAHFFSEHIGSFIYCEGDSMLPTIQDGDLIWSSRCSKLERLKERDIVCLVNPVDPTGNVMKRITAFRKERHSSALEIEVHGDNHENSIDSRHYGPVLLGLCRYKALLRVWPWERRGWVI